MNQFQQQLSSSSECSEPTSVPPPGGVVVPSSLDPFQTVLQVEPLHLLCVTQASASVFPARCEGLPVVGEGDQEEVERVVAGKVE